MEDKTPVYVIAAIVVVGALLGLLLWLRSGAPAGSEPEDRQPLAAKAAAKPEPRQRTGLSGGGEPTAPAEPASPARQTGTGPAPRPAPSRPATGATDPGKPAREEGWEFTPDDIKLSNRKIFLSVGDYRVAQGQDVEFELLLDAPPLESATLVFTYDPTALEYVEDSAKGVGRAFRKGVECHTDPATGRLAIIHVGMPGKKNVLASMNEKVITFRMKALKPGPTALKPAVEGISFTNGQGRDEEFQVTGGAVRIE